MLKCQICGKEFKNIIGLATHVAKSEKQVATVQEYYDKYIKQDPNENICKTCGNETSFRGITKGYSDYCSPGCVSKDADIRKKVENTCLERFGATVPAKSEKVKEKSKNTCLERYGVENAFQNKEIQKRQQDILFEKYGVRHNSQMEGFLEKREKTSVEKYGNKYPMQCEEMKNRIRETNMKKYGGPAPACSDEVKSKMSVSFLNKMYERILNSKKFNEKIIPNFDVSSYKGIKHRYEWICKSCGDIIFANLQDSLPRCLKCNPYNINQSEMENDLSNYYSEIGVDLIKNDREILDSMELDLYFPKSNVAVEMDGLYWHSECSGKKNQNYHYLKTLLCWKKNVFLFHIFEDEWMLKSDIVKSMINNKLNIFDEKIYARKCEIKEVNKEEGEWFLENNHLQGFLNSKVCLGLYSNDEIVSILTFGNPRFNKEYEWEILRFCNKTNTRVLGGFSKLLKKFLNEYDPKSIITYADLRYGNGEVYEKNGFKRIRRSNPSYYYLNGYTMRINRLNYQKHLLEDKLEVYDSNLTEWENMQLNGYDRIWDCGSLVYSFEKESL